MDIKTELQNLMKSIKTKINLIDNSIEGNKAIRVFMQHELLDVHISYDKDWNSLMPVVQRVKSTQLKEPITGTGIISILTRVDTALVQCKIELVWLAVVEFVNWYNHNQNNNNG